MIRLSIRRKIMGIAVVLTVLMAVTAVLSMVSVMQVGERLEELTQSYIPALEIWRGRISVRWSGVWRCAAW
jgi:adenylate cyclase